MIYIANVSFLRDGLPGMLVYYSSRVELVKCEYEELDAVPQPSSVICALVEVVEATLCPISGSCTYVIILYIILELLLLALKLILVIYLVSLVLSLK